MALTGIERIAQRASSQPGSEFTTLMHHYTVENLRPGFEVLDGKKAPGVDGVTKAEYGQNLEDNLRELHRKLHQMSYRPQALRRVEIPAEDGTLRPLGSSCLEDKIIQEMTRQILEAIYEPVLIETSYGCRPQRTKPVNWIADLDLAQFFAPMPHQEILAVMQERIKDRKFLHLMARMLKAGVQTPGGIVQDELGSPQGSIVSPVIANVFLEHVLDQWFTQIVTRHCRGDCAILSSADDSIAVFEFEDDAQRCMRVLPKRLEKSGLRLNRDNTQPKRVWQAPSLAVIEAGETPSHP